MHPYIIEDYGESEIFFTEMQISIENEEKQGKDDKEENYGDTMKFKGDTEKPMEKHPHEPSSLLLLYYSYSILYKLFISFAGLSKGYTTVSLDYSIFTMNFYSESSILRV